MKTTYKDVKNLAECVNTELKKKGSKMFIQISNGNDRTNIEEATEEQMKTQCAQRSILYGATNKEAFKYLQAMNETLRLLNINN
mgnify:CR=1 FL=1